MATKERIHLRIGKRASDDVTDRFEAALDLVQALDPVPFHIKREAAEKAAQLALDYICMRLEG